MPKRTAAAKPEPVPVNVVCSLCGEPWSLHCADANGEVTTLECIKLLKAAKNRIGPTYIPQPYPVYPRYPGWWQTTPIPQVTWTTTTTGGNEANDYRCTINAANTPKILAASTA